MISKDELINGARKPEVIGIFIFVLLACAAMAFDKPQGVPIYIMSLLLIAGAATLFKHDNMRVAALIAIVALSFFSIYSNGVKFGIDFSGGVRIPVLLEKPVNAVTMEEMVSTIKTRSASFGLSEVKVRPIGDSEIYVELPQSSEQLVRDVETLLSKQGVYQGVVDGKVAVSGNDIYTGTIARVLPQYLQGADWGVQFSVTQAGAHRFANVSKGKANYPLYMFLDRPSDAIIVISEKELLENTKKNTLPLTRSRALELAKLSLKLEGEDIMLYLEEDLARNFSAIPSTNRTKAILTAGSNLTGKLREAGFAVVEKPEGEMTPEYMVAADNPLSDAVVTWKAVGLMSAPRLVPSVTEGIPNFSYVVNGPAVGATTTEKTADAAKKERELESILKGGALPVQITIGSKTVIPAPLGAEFLRLSLIGMAFSLITIALMVALRYRHLSIIMPMVAISAAELVILMAILGSFTIDLAGMAGILAAIGVGVDAQIIVTDELLKKDEESRKRMEKAFAIITTSVTVAVVAMLPLLLFSGLVEVIGFATATVLGSLLGLFISRPAYGAIAERLFD